jgi:hypothetical protein
LVLAVLVRMYLVAEETQEATPYSLASQLLVVVLAVVTLVRIVV